MFRGGTFAWWLDHRSAALFSGLNPWWVSSSSYLQVGTCFKEVACWRNSIEVLILTLSSHLFSMPPICLCWWVFLHHPLLPCISVLEPNIWDWTLCKHKPKWIWFPSSHECSIYFCSRNGKATNPKRCFKAFHLLFCLFSEYSKTRDKWFLNIYFNVNGLYKWSYLLIHSNKHYTSCLSSRKFMNYS